MVVSPGGNTAYRRVKTPSPLAKGNPYNLDADFHARERHKHQMRQSKRLLDTRSRNTTAAAGIDNQRLLLGLQLLREAVTGQLVGLSNVQLRGTIVNALVCLHTPHDSEYDYDPREELCYSVYCMEDEDARAKSKGSES